MRRTQRVENAGRRSANLPGCCEDRVTISIRPYCSGSDLERCMDIWRRASGGGHPFLTDEQLGGDEVLVRDVYMPAADIWVVAEGETVIGFIALLEDFIGGLFVAPERQGEGTGRALVLHAADIRGALGVEVYESNDAAREFYARLGFIQAGRRESDDQGRPFPLISMRRPADPASVR